MLVADGNNGLVCGDLWYGSCRNILSQVWVLNMTYGSNSYDVGPVQWLQNLTVGVPPTPHLLDIDEATGGASEPLSMSFALPAIS
jgi:hypothetical protein